MKYNTIIEGDCLDVMKEISDNSIDMVLTDPPYFLDKLDNEWDSDIVKKRSIGQVIQSLPYGMKFDRAQGERFYEWYRKVSSEVLRILKPGGFFLSFSSPRLYHRMTSAIDDVGFEVRDSLIWLYTQSQMKAMGLDHVAKRRGLTAPEGYKTPQLKSCFEPVCVAQKTVEKDYLYNWNKYGVGLINTNIKVGDGMSISNVISNEYIDSSIDKVFLIGKPKKELYNNHPTVKPVILCEHLINVFTKGQESIVLDPFSGSGTTLVAAKNTNRIFLGIEKNKEYVNIIKKRLEEDVLRLY